MFSQMNITDNNKLINTELGRSTIGIRSRSSDMNQGLVNYPRLFSFGVTLSVFCFDENIC